MYERTGRTTQMLLDAIEASKNGDEVYVYSTADHANYIRHVHLPRLCPRGVPANIYVAMISQYFDWLEMRTIGHPPSTKFFVDHLLFDNGTARKMTNKQISRMAEPQP